MVWDWILGNKAWMEKFIWIYLWISFLLSPHLHTTYFFSLSSSIPLTVWVLNTSTISHWKQQLEKNNLIPNDSICGLLLWVSELENTDFSLLLLDPQEQIPRVYCKILRRLKKKKKFHLSKNKRAVKKWICRLRPSQNWAQICTVMKYIFFIATYLSTMSLN